MKTFHLHIAVFWSVATPEPCVHTSEPIHTRKVSVTLLKTLYPALRLSVQTGAQGSN